MNVFLPCFPLVWGTEKTGIIVLQSSMETRPSKEGSWEKHSSKSRPFLVWILRHLHLKSQVNKPELSNIWTLRGWILALGSGGFQSGNFIYLSLSVTTIPTDLPVLGARGVQAANWSLQLGAGSEGLEKGLNCREHWRSEPRIWKEEK